MIMRHRLYATGPAMGILICGAARRLNAISTAGTRIHENTSLTHAVFAQAFITVEMTETYRRASGVRAVPPTRRLWTEAYHGCGNTGCSAAATAGRGNTPLMSRSGSGCSRSSPEPAGARIAVDLFWTTFAAGCSPSRLLPVPAPQGADDHEGAKVFHHSAPRHDAIGFRDGLNAFSLQRREATSARRRRGRDSGFQSSPSMISSQKPVLP